MQSPSGGCFFLSRWQPLAVGQLISSSPNIVHHLKSPLFERAFLSVSINRRDSNDQMWCGRAPLARVVLHAANQTFDDRRWRSYLHLLTEPLLYETNLLRATKNAAQILCGILHGYYNTFFIHTSHLFCGANYVIMEVTGRRDQDE